MNRSRIAILIGTATLIAVACSKTPPAPPPAPDNSAAEAARRDSIARAEQAQRDAAARAEQARRDSLAKADAAHAAAAAAAETRRVITAPIHFDFDSDVLTDEARGILDAKIPMLTKFAAVKIQVEGNADERGSDEYNLALGQRRAAAAKRYLVQHGVPDSRVDVISYGEERPMAQGHDESAWSQNRRDEFQITAGGESIATVPAQ